MILSLTVAFAAGVFTWSLLEYLLHRFSGHERKFAPEFSRQHLMHHADTDYYAPTSRKLAVALPVLTLAGLLAGVPFGPAVGAAYALGFGAFYGFYEVLHRRTHTHAPIGAYGRWARRHHLHHHFRSPKKNHGVTSPLWDIVFRTYDAPQPQLKVPPKQVMDWLLDEQGQVKPPYRDDYVLVAPRK